MQTSEVRFTGGETAIAGVTAATWAAGLLIVRQFGVALDDAVIGAIALLCAAAAFAVARIGRASAT